MPRLYSRKVAAQREVAAAVRKAYEVPEPPVLRNVWTDVAVALTAPDKLRSPVARLIRAAIEARPDWLDPADLRPQYIDAAIAALLSAARESGQVSLKHAADRLERARKKVAL